MKKLKITKLFNPFRALLIVLVCLPFISSATIVITGGSWTSNGFGATVTDPDITISGTFTIDVNAKFDNCTNIKMASGALIVVNDVVNFTIDNSHIYTVGTWMWKGILMKGTPTSGGFIRMTSTIIEDAEMAISGAYPIISGSVVPMQANYSFDLLDVKFNRN